MASASRVEGEDELFEAISNPIRREIIVLLYDRVEMSYSEIQEHLGISGGLLNFHLRRLSGLVEKAEDGSYRLTAKGILAYRIVAEARRGLERLGARRVSRLPPVSLGMAARRLLASTIDVAVFFLATGAIFDPVLWGFTVTSIAHLAEALAGHPWILHGDHLGEAAAVLSRLVAAYSHVFFAIYIFLTLLEAYKGQTIGKYLLGLRVVKRSGRRLTLVEAGIRNAGKLFLLPVDVILAAPYWRRGYLRYTDYYVDAVVVREGERPGS